MKREGGKEGREGGRKGREGESKGRREGYDTLGLVLIA